MTSPKMSFKILYPVNRSDTYRIISLYRILNHWDLFNGPSISEPNNGFVTCTWTTESVGYDTPIHKITERLLQICQGLESLQLLHLSLMPEAFTWKSGLPVLSVVFDTSLFPIPSDVDISPTAIITGPYYSDFMTGYVNHTTHVVQCGNVLKNWFGDRANRYTEALMQFDPLDRLTSKMSMDVFRFKSSRQIFPPRLPFQQTSRDESIIKFYHDKYLDRKVLRCFIDQSIGLIDRCSLINKILSPEDALNIVSQGIDTVSLTWDDFKSLGYQVFSDTPMLRYPNLESIWLDYIKSRSVPGLTSSQVREYSLSLSIQDPLSNQLISSIQNPS